MRKLGLAAIAATVLAVAAGGVAGGISAQTPAPILSMPDVPTLAQEREGKEANPLVEYRQDRKPRKPPVDWMELVSYPTPLGEMAAYLARPDKQSEGAPELAPAIVWISGGNLAIGDFWSKNRRSNDQSAQAFRDAGMIVFYPATRGLNGNPGAVEGYFGELDDLVAATQWLKQQPGVDPSRIYLGGHSSGGTMALLAAQYANEWKATFAFGPVIDPQLYGPGLWGVQLVANDDAEGRRLRAPIHWLGSIRSPTLIVEGTVRANDDDVRRFERRNRKPLRNPLVKTALIEGCSHFSILRPLSETIAEAIMKDEVRAFFAQETLEADCG